MKLIVYTALFADPNLTANEVGYKIWNTESIIIGITHWMQLPSKPACS